MTNHTPAPWVAVGTWVEIPEDDIPDICSCNPESINQEGRTYEEMIANANLIAAAPELLEACRQAIKIVASLAESSPYYKNLHKLLYLAIMKATAHIEEDK